MMNKTILDFNFFGMRTTAARSTLFGSLILLIMMTGLALFITDLTPLDTFIAGVLATFLHWLNGILHQYGHYLAGKQIGKPASGLRLWWLLGTTLYPKNEGTLPPTVHIRRALGGPIMSTIVLLIVLLLAAFFWSVGGMLQFLLGWLIFDNVAVFSLGAFVPIKIRDFVTDGGTILNYWRQYRQHS